MKTEYDKPNKRILVTLSAEENQMLCRAMVPPGDDDGKAIMREINRQSEMHYLEYGLTDVRIIVDWSNKKATKD